MIAAAVFPATKMALPKSLDCRHVGSEYPKSTWSQGRITLRHATSLWYGSSAACPTRGKLLRSRVCPEGKLQKWIFICTLTKHPERRGSWFELGDLQTFPLPTTRKLACHSLRLLFLLDWFKRKRKDTSLFCESPYSRQSQMCGEASLPGLPTPFTGAAIAFQPHVHKPFLTYNSWPSVHRT